MYLGLRRKKRLLQKKAIDPAYHTRAVEELAKSLTKGLLELHHKSPKSVGWKMHKKCFWYRGSSLLDSDPELKKALDSILKEKGVEKVYWEQLAEILNQLTPEFVFVKSHGYFLAKWFEARFIRDPEEITEAQLSYA